jgi:4-diphosphocytidyl-2-C-methyl-D-erythritol kinase
MTGLTETAYAKINLALYVRRRRADGYHDLESLFAFAEEGDHLSIAGAGDFALTISGPFAAGLSNGDDNLVIRAARQLAAAFGISTGVTLALDKQLPVASGIGGGSADAAATLRLLARHWGLDLADPRIVAIAADLGADVPACLASVSVHGDGKGDQLTPLADNGLSGMPLLLVNPRIPLGTGEVFARWDGVDRGAFGSGDPIIVALAGRNDLTDPAVELVPEIGDILALLESLSGVILVRMSGSGATCFALFETFPARDIGAAMVSLAMPDAWTMASTLR